MFPFPKIIHLSYKSKDSIPEMWKEVLPRWEKTHPDWEIKFWSDEDNDNIVKNNFPWFLDTYNSFPHKIQKCDSVRACYLYEFGGVYVDMDYLPKKNLNTLFENTDNDLYFTQSANIKCFTNSFMASKPKIEFWMDYLKSMINQKIPWYYTKHFVIYHTTGPFKLDELIYKYSKIVGFIPPKIINACTICDKKCNLNKLEEVYLQSIEGQTWNSIDTHIGNFIFCNYKLLLKILIVILIYLGFKLKKRLDSCPIR